MRVCVLLILALIGHSGATLKDIIQKSSERGMLPVRARPPRAASLEQHPSPRSMFGDNVNLAWVDWTGSLPNNAVSIYNGYTQRTDYICKSDCEAGFYSPGLGSYCHYPYAGRKQRTSNFQVLVNVDNFEFLEWEKGSYGSAPQHAVRTCPGVNVFVGKNKYGLGKVVTQHEAFFLPWEGYEYWYKTYHVLSINRDAYSQHISHVVYTLNNGQNLLHPPETMRISGVTNNACQAVTKTVTISKETETETTWSIGRSTMVGVTASITANIPLLGSSSISMGVEQTWTFQSGTTIKEKLTHSVSVGLSVPPNHSCSVRMEGRKFTAHIPYTARLSRTYTGGEIRWTSIVGMYDGVQIGEVRAVVERCEPVANPRPCP